MDLSNRFERFKIFSTHPHYGKLVDKLATDDLDIIYNFIKINENLDRNDFVFKVNRMFVGQQLKPRSWPLITEFLILVA